MATVEITLRQQELLSMGLKQVWSPPPLFILFIKDADTHILVAVHCCVLLWYCRADRKRMLFVVHQRPAQRWFHVNEAPPLPATCLLHSAFERVPLTPASSPLFILLVTVCQDAATKPSRESRMLPPPPFIWLHCPPPISDRNLHITIQRPPHPR